MMATKKVKRGLSAQLAAISLFTLCFCAPLVMAQSPTPSPAPANGANVTGADALTELVIVAGNLIPRVQEAIESPLVKGLENLAFWIAVIVMLFSFARLFRENDGATKDLFWWCFRLAIVFTLFGTGRTIINTWSQIGYDIVNVTEFRKVLWDAETEFNTNYDKFTEGMFLVKATNASEALAALTTDDVSLRNIASAANPSAWSLPNIFIGVTIGRAILQFSNVFLALLSALILIALRLFAPFAIALAIDRGLAQRISWPFVWSAAVFTMVTPLVSHIIGYIVYQVGNMALTIIKFAEWPESQIFSLAADGSITGDPNMVGSATAACVVLIVLMVVSALLLLASPYISYKLAFGQIFEAVSATAAGWMGALTATGIEIAGITFGSALQRQASETRIEGQAQAEIARAMATREASDIQSRAHKILSLQSASASRTQSLGAIAGGYAMALQMNEAQRQATSGLIEQSNQQQVVGILADRSFGQRQAGIQASREERDLRITQAQQNVGTLINRGLEMTEHTAGGMARLGGSSAPLLPAAEEGTKIITSGGERRR